MKIDILYKDKQSTYLFWKALKNINNIRNKVAHKFTFDANNITTNAIDNFLLDIDRSDISMMDSISKIEKFTEFCILYFGYQKKEIALKIEEIYNHYHVDANTVRRKYNSIV